MWAKIKEVNPLFWLALVTVLLFYSCYEDGVHSQQDKDAKVALIEAGDSIGTLNTKLTTASHSGSAAILKIDTLWRERVKYITIADDHGHKADSIFNLAPADTAGVCKEITKAYNERTTECAELRLAVRADSEAIRVGVDSLHSIVLKLDSAKTEVVTVRADLKNALTIHQCKVILFVPCPSRKLSFALGILGGGYLGWRITQ